MRKFSAMSRRRSGRRAETGSQKSQRAVIYLWTSLLHHMLLPGMKQTRSAALIMSVTLRTTSPRSSLRTCLSKWRLARIKRVPAWWWKQESSRTWSTATSALLRKTSATLCPRQSWHSSSMKVAKSPSQSSFHRSTKLVTLSSYSLKTPWWLNNASAAETS